VSGRERERERKREREREGEREREREKERERERVGERERKRCADDGTWGTRFAKGVRLALSLVPLLVWREAITGRLRCDGSFVCTPVP